MLSEEANKKRIVLIDVALNRDKKIVAAHQDVLDQQQFDSRQFEHLKQQYISEKQKRLEAEQKLELQSKQNIIETFR